MFAGDPSYLEECENKTRFVDLILIHMLFMKLLSMGEQKSFATFKHGKHPNTLEEK